MATNPYIPPKATINDSVPRDHTRPLWAGVVIAPLASPFSAALLAMLVEPGIYVSVVDAALMFPIIAVTSILFSLIAMTALGLPVVLLLRKVGWFSFFSVCVTSVPIGATLWIGLRAAEGDRTMSFVDAVFGGGVALSVAIAFYLVVRPSSFKPTPHQGGA